ncbi:hypothetical protein KBD59_00420 [Candidatus Gracilibacteria bacterium]|nr:hypothetical protein [Candidatus Gracilibacteria bacterium]
MTADAFETTVAVTEATADNTITIPNGSGAVLLSTAGVADIASAFWGASNGIVFEGATANGFETTITLTDPTADNTITFGDETGTVITTGSTTGVTSTMITDATIAGGDLAADIAITTTGAAALNGNVDLGNAATDLINVNGAIQTGTPFIFDGATLDGNVVALLVADPGADFSVTLPAVTGTLITTGDTGTVSSTMITDATIAAADLNGGIIISTTGLITANGGIVQDYSTAIKADAFSAAGLNVINLEATSADVNTITNGVAGQMLILLFNDAVTVADDDTATAANAINLVGIATSFVAAAGDTLTLVSDGSSWREVTRSVNN